MLGRVPPAFREELLKIGKAGFLQAVAVALPVTESTVSKRRTYDITTCIKLLTMMKISKVSLITQFTVIVNKYHWT